MKYFEDYGKIARNARVEVKARVRYGGRICQQFNQAKIT